MGFATSAYETPSLRWGLGIGFASVVGKLTCMSGGPSIHPLLRDRDVDCPSCGYNLRNSGGEACPECGRALTLEQLQAPAEPRAPLAMWLGIAALLTCWLGIGLFPGLAAIYAGISAVNAIDRQGGRRLNRQQAQAGVFAGGVASVVAVLAFVSATVSIGTSHRYESFMRNRYHLRVIHQAMVTFASSNNGYFPGLDANGNDLNPDVEDRFWLLLDGNYFTGEYALNPLETAPLVEWQSGPVTSANYSFAMLQIPPQGPRRTEWSDTLNAQAIAVSDRNIGTPAQPASVFNSQVWEGAIAWNDNHVGYYKSPVQATQYNGGPAHAADDLFQSAGDDDALMVHSGN